MRLLRLILLAASIISLCAFQAAQGGEWLVHERHGNFELSSQFKIAPQVLWDELKDVSQELAKTLQVAPTEDPVRIVLFTDQQTYIAALAPGLPQVRLRKALFVRSGNVSSIYAYQSRTLAADLRHEATHAFLHQHLPFLPLWLDEGLAEYLEEKRSQRQTSSRASTVRWKARIGWKPDLKLLEAIPSAEKMEPGDYRDSWAWVCFLLNESPETQDLLVKYLATIHQGGDPGPFSAFGESSMPDLSKRAASYLRRIPGRAFSTP